MESRRSVTPNKEMIETLRKQKGWSVQQLSEEAEIGMRTAQKAVAGIPVGMDSLRRIADALEVEYDDLLLGNASPLRMKVQVVIQLDLFRAEAKEVADFIKLLGKTLPASHEIVIKEMRDGSLIITLDMSHEDAVRLVSLFPDLGERMRDILRETPEGMAYFRGEKTAEAGSVRRLLEMVDAVIELRIKAEPPALPDLPTPPEPSTPPENWEPYYDRFRDNLNELGKLISETRSEPPGEERERKLAAMQKALEKLWQDFDDERKQASQE